MSNIPINEKVENFYPSRVGREEEIIDRIDPIIYEGGKRVGDYSLDETQLKNFEERGFVVIENYFSSDEIDTMKEEFDRISSIEDNLSKEEFIKEKNSDSVRSIFSLEKFSKLYDKISKDPRMLDIAEQLLGSKVYLHHSRINIKPPIDGKSFSWHSDFETWHVEDGLPRIRCVTGWIMLTDNHAYNGPLFVIPKSHKKFVSCEGRTPKENHKESLRYQVYGSPKLESIKQLCKDANNEIVGVYGKAGTVVFHEANIMHGSPDNISPWPRTNMFFVYNSIHNTPVDPPFGAPKLRPQFLCNRDFTPLR